MFQLIYTNISLLLSLLFIVIIFYYSYLSLKITFQKNSKENKTVFLLFFGLFVFNLYFFSPRGHQVFYDESIYLNVAQNMVRENQTCRCVYGEKDRCLECVLDRHPSGNPALYSWLFIINGDIEKKAAIFSFLLSLIIGLLNYRLAFFVFKNPTALFSLLAISFLPFFLHFTFSQIAEKTMIVAMTTIALSFFFIKEKKKFSLLSLFISLSFLFYIKIEAIFFLIPFALLLFKNKQLIPPKKLFLSAILFLLSLLPHFYQVFQNRNDDWQSSNGPRFGIRYFGETFEANISYLFSNKFFPLIIMILLLIGVFWKIKKEIKKSDFLILWGFTFFTIFLFFYFGKYTGGGDSDRFLFSILTPLSILAGRGIFYLQKKKNNIFFIGFNTLILVTIFLVCSSFINRFRIKEKNNLHSLKILHRINNDNRNIYKDCLVIASNHSANLTQNISSVNNSFFYNNYQRRDFFSKNKCVIFFWDLGCYGNGQQLCSRILNRFLSRKILETKYNGFSNATYFLLEEKK